MVTPIEAPSLGEFSTNFKVVQRQDTVLINFSQLERIKINAVVHYIDSYVVDVLTLDNLPVNCII